MNSQLIIRDGDVDHAYNCANGFVSRCVAAVHVENHSDARKLARILNDHFQSALSHQPAPVAANASAEARLRENQGELYLRRDEVRKILIEQPEENLDVTEGVLADIDNLTTLTRLEIRYPAVVRDFLWTVIQAYYNNAWSSNREHIVSRANELFESLSAHPHASDCDKQGRELTKRERDCVEAALFASGTVVDETTKSEGGEPDAERTQHRLAVSDDGLGPMQAIPREPLSGPSVRTVDVTEAELRAWLLERSDKTISEIVEAMRHAFTVGRR